MIDGSKSYTTREGGAVLMYTTTAPDDRYPVVAHIHTRRYGWLLAEFTHDGRYAFADLGKRCPYDLVLAPPAPTLKAEHVELSIAPSYGVVCALCGREGHASPACPWALTVVHGEAACG